MSKSTSVRLKKDTVDDLRMATAELSVQLRTPLLSDDARIMALIDYWRRTKNAKIDAITTSIDGITTSGAVTQ